MRRTSAAAAVLTLASGGSACPGTGGSGRGPGELDLETVGSAPHEGSAHAWGTLTWYDSTRTVATGRLNDRCPTDGCGAYLDLMVEHLLGDVYAHLEAASDSGCDGPVEVAFSPIIHDTASRNDLVIRLCLNELDMPFRLLGDTSASPRTTPTPEPVRE